MPSAVPPWSLLVALAAGSAFSLVHFFPAFADHSIFRLFCGIYGVLALGRMTYTIIVWPKFLSPLRHLPSAPVSAEPHVI